MRKFEVDPEALEAAGRDRSVPGMRAYDRAVANLDEWGRAWREHVQTARAAGVSVEEIAERAGVPVRDVLPALGPDDESED
jgi:hypothetical protein